MQAEGYQKEGLHLGRDIGRYRRGQIRPLGVFRIFNVGTALSVLDYEGKVDVKADEYRLERKVQEIVQWIRP